MSSPIFVDTSVLSEGILALVQALSLSQDMECSSYDIAAEFLKLVLTQRADDRTARLWLAAMRECQIAHVFVITLSTLTSTPSRASDSERFCNTEALQCCTPVDVCPHSLEISACACMQPYDIPTIYPAGPERAVIHAFL